ncbi:tat pathway signal sequence [Pseudomassariella vexata]|uniref:Tat pathway signal sequence n=1 Tax=Pseudomassariella vexata TaxID=1141098 RepID=A0A1Y2DHU0_9PEZI|nr:tat pathway signal sequence [Pseudomassariella vexata]ORY58812.1 tat pathway signal sequence [Pseudomassariella vexata]
MPHQLEKDEQHRSLTSQYEDSTDDCESEVSNIPFRHHPWRTRWQASSYFSLALFILTVVISAILGALLAFHSINLDIECSHHTTQYSPLLKDLDIKYDWEYFNGSFKAQTIYRLPGSPEVDEAWEALGVDSRASIIPYSEGLLSGLNPHHVQVSPKYGGGFFVNVEGMHHLHCLNLLRKALWYNYEYYKDLGTHAFKNEEYIVRLHASHCLDTIRQVLMCNADTGVLGQVWYNPKDVRAFPDFQTRHKCKNFDQIRRWALEHQAPGEEEMPEDFLKAPRREDVLNVDI